MKRNVIICFVILFAFVYDVNGELNEQKIVQTSNGRVRGHLKYTLFKNASYYAFLGIPYAEKPIGERRFQASVPITSWEPTILDALHYGNSCIQQSNAIGNSGPESEDCLYLNIFVPGNIKSYRKLAVIFFIHGGGFAEGSGNEYFYGPDFLIEHGVISVTINYRLGVFGFMSLNTMFYSGNMGLKDQQMALKWIHQNIDAFGGDSKRITLMGQSAGAVSVHYHVLIPESRKLIRAAICLSGSAFLRYAYLDEKSHLEEMLAFARKSNKSIQRVKDLIGFLQNEPTQTIVKETSETSYGMTLIFKWAPTLERESSNQPILTKTPHALYKRDTNVNVDMIFGYTNYENLALGSNLISNITALDDFVNKFDVELPVHNLKPNFKSSAYRKILNKVNKYYFHNVTTEHDKAKQFVNMLSDLNMVTPIDRAVKKQSKNSKHSTYYYQFSIDGKLNFIKRKLNITWPGATHGDDLCYIFRCHSIDSVYGDIVKTMYHDESSKITYDTIHLMSAMFANFAKFRRPFVDGRLSSEVYQPVCANAINFLDITNSALIPGTSPKKHEISFWKRIILQAQRLIATSKNNAISSLTV